MGPFWLKICCHHDFFTHPPTARKSLAMVGHEKTCNKDFRNIAAVKRLSVSFGWKDATFVII